MPAYEHTGDAYRSVTERCLIAADVDKTLLAHDEAGDGERDDGSTFVRTVALDLLEAAALGTHLAFLTANSMDQLTARFLSWLATLICTHYAGHLEIFDRLHFFSNSGGVYSHFPSRALRAALGPGAQDNPDRRALLAVLTTAAGADGQPAVQPAFIDMGYVERCCIPDEHQPHILALLQDAVARYTADLAERRDEYAKTYRLALVSDGDQIVPARVEARPVAYGPGDRPRQATVQMTVKPVLSFRHTDDPEQPRGDDCRSALAAQIQGALDAAWPGLYRARPGGASSIDVTLAKLDKAYALAFLIDRLNLGGDVRAGGRPGSNVIYFGDEVLVGDGYDYAAARVPGVLALWPNPQPRLASLPSGGVAADACAGPAATAGVLRQYNDCARTLLAVPAPGMGDLPAPTAVDEFKRQFFAASIWERIEGLAGAPLAGDDWQMLYGLVTRLCGAGPARRSRLAAALEELL